MSEEEVDHDQDDHNHHQDKPESPFQKSFREYFEKYQREWKRTVGKDYDGDFESWMSEGLSKWAEEYAYESKKRPQAWEPPPHEDILLRKPTQCCPYPFQRQYFFRQAKRHWPQLSFNMDGQYN